MGVLAATFGPMKNQLKLMMLHLSTGKVTDKFNNKKAIHLRGLKMKKILSLLVIASFLLSGAVLASINTPKTVTPAIEDTTSTAEIKTIEKTIHFSEPSVVENGKYVIIKTDNSNNVLKNEENPMIPYRVETVEFPIGTKIVSVEVQHSEPKEMELTKKIAPAPVATATNMQNSPAKVIEGKIYNSNEPYPQAWDKWNVGVGLDGYKHVIYLSVQLYPSQYNAGENKLSYVTDMDVKIKYTPPSKPLLTNDVYDLLIVTPAQFSDALQPLVDHKNSHGISTMLVTLDEIYNGNYFAVQGRDDAEKIKYFIKDAVEEWGVKYVMLVGDVKKMPIRYIFFAQKWQHRYYNETMPTDLYYADIYDANGSFSSWDSNGNGVYGEEFDNCEGVNDTMDMYADVYIGRLACKNRFVAKTVVNKIISYEDKAFGEDWFKRLVLIGGDTFPGWGVVEGEFMNQLVADEMPDFNPVKIWYSLGNLNAMTIEKELEKGAGFVHFSGHGFPWGWGTHPVNGDDNEWVGTYYTPYVTALFNGYRLPVIFFDACSTGELDLTVSDIGKEFGVPMPNISVSLPCFAWYFVQKRGGGAIATVGSTRVAFTGVDSNGPYAGAGYLVYKFFDGYHKGATPSEMLVHSQNEYMNNEWKDRWSICEFILFGDPSLHIGGFE